MGILALGDALNVIFFPMYQLGLPNTWWANAVVFALGVGLLVVTYRLFQVSVGDVQGSPPTPPAADGGYDDRDPEQILKARFARGELSGAEFEEMKAHLAEFGGESATGGSTDAAGSPTRRYDSAREFAENHELHDRETIID